MTKLVGVPKNYDKFLDALKKEILAARTKAMLSVNSELVSLYWKIGTQILKRQKQEGWGAKIVEKVAQDLHHEFPGMTGFSAPNLHKLPYMGPTKPNLNQ